MTMTENLYYANAVLWARIQENKSLLISGGLAAEVIGVLAMNGWSPTVHQCHLALTSISHYKFHLATILCGSIITGIGKVVLHSWGQEIEKVRNTPPNSPVTPRPKD
jgi:hypothetical protein